MSKQTKVTIPYCPRFPQADIHRELEAHRFSVLVAHRRMGKTVLAVNHLIKQAILCRRQRPVLAYIAPFRGQAKQVAWDYLKHFTTPIPGRSINESELMLTLPNGAVIRLFGADNPDALRGLYFDGVVMDEVAQMKPEVWQEIVRPALADRNGWAVFIGTPKGQNLFAQLYELARREQKAGNPDWCAMLYRVDQTHAVPDEELAALKAEMSENAYKQEFLCDFAAASDDVFIPLQIVQEAVNRDMDNTMYQHAPIVLGVDVARFGDDRSVITVRQGLMLLEQVSYRGLDLMALSGKVAAKAQEVEADAVFVDGVGVGAGVVDRLRQLGLDVIDAQAGAKAIDPSKYVNRRAEMWQAMRDWLKAGGSIPDDPDLVADLIGLTYSFAPGGQVKLESKDDLKKRGLPSPDTADSLALTFFDPVFSKRDLPGMVGKSGFAQGYKPMGYRDDDDEQDGRAPFARRWVDERTTF